jgi:transglutaminase-like putative cysteine protease
MMRLAIRHRTAYAYDRPVVLGEHRMMFRPRDSHDLRLVEATLAVDPAPVSIRWVHDIFGNSVAIASFSDAPATSLTFDSRLTVDTYEIEGPDFPIESYAQSYPFSYAADDMPDLARSIERQFSDPSRAVDAWAKRFVTGPATPTADLLAAMTRTIRADFAYAARDAPGVQAPDETLRLGSGSCRDFAVLMMEAVRALGLAARFVSGYVYSRGADGGNVGGGATHAWMQVYLPGAGWVEYDPTNAILGTRDLVRVAVARRPDQAAPLDGSFTGPGNVTSSLSVDVAVERLDGAL